MSDKFFNSIRFLSEVAITAVGVLYKTIAEIWGFGYGDAVLATCAALSTFLGIFTEWQRCVYTKRKENEDESDS